MLSWLVTAWLLGQVASFAAGPALTALGLDVDECCRNAGPGQSCPMHRAREGDGTCKMRSGCPRADFALVSMASGIAILPDPTDPVTAFEPGQVERSVEPSTIGRAARPYAPPPRV